MLKSPTYGPYDPPLRRRRRASAGAFALAAPTSSRSTRRHSRNQLKEHAFSSWSLTISTIVPQYAEELRRRRGRAVGGGNMPPGELTARSRRRRHSPPT